LFDVCVAKGLRVFFEEINLSFFLDAALTVSIPSMSSARRLLSLPNVERTSRVTGSRILRKWTIATK
jgi:hypothetical protein